MADIATTIQTTPEGPAFALRQDVYRPGEAQELIADVVSLANVITPGKRYIVFGVEAARVGEERRVAGIATSPNPQMWQHLVREYIEPEIRIEYRTETLAERQVGVLIVPPCHQAPYMIKRALGDLERGTSFIRRDQSRDRLVRADLEQLYARRYDLATRFAGLRVGFEGDEPLEVLALNRQDDAALPSHVHTSKLRQLIEARASADKLGGSDSGIVRMVHVRVFGTDVPYESRTRSELERALAGIQASYREQDRHARYERDAARVDLVVLNESAEPLEDAALIVHFPIIEGFEVLWGAEDAAAEGHVEGKRESAALSIARTLGRIETGMRASAFAQPLRVVLTGAFPHNVVPVRYELRAANLPSPLLGKLRFEVA